ncbi:hypothetical protein [Labrys wisconsinensis]|uniref:Uncharacterized protein n=1 Tax=Labrys wisconsinensis TaxID=425677 RepID=A0ABU0JI38_9HYPH|nr:hypothetical protein [Labrys wisconsinensis]MDQ0472787.1 hypothetical protein [Labrys wisconsinensis]
MLPAIRSHKQPTSAPVCLARQALSAHAANVKAMAKDVSKFLLDRGEDATIEDADLRRRGWSKAQIEEYGAEAIALGSRRAA